MRFPIRGLRFALYVAGALGLGVCVSRAQTSGATYPIDLPTALRLAGAQNLDVQIARLNLNRQHGQLPAAQHLTLAGLRAIQLLELREELRGLLPDRPSLLGIALVFHLPRVLGQCLGLLCALSGSGICLGSFGPAASLRQLFGIQRKPQCRQLTAMIRHYNQSLIRQDQG